MLPSIIIGSVVLPGGEQPFVLDTASGRVAVGRYEAADAHQAEMGPGEAAVAERQVRAKVKSVREVRLGVFRCPECKRWIDVVSQPSSWAKERCDQCG